MNIKAGAYFSVELFNEDAQHFVNALSKIAEEQGAMGFKKYGLTEEEVNVIIAVINELG